MMKVGISPELETILRDIKSRREFYKILESGRGGKITINSETYEISPSEKLGQRISKISSSDPKKEKILSPE